MNEYAITYTIYHTRDNKIAPRHKKYAFKSDSDLLGAADEGMCKIYDQYAKDTEDDILFRAIELTNAKEVYENLKPLNGDLDE